MGGMMPIPWSKAWDFADRQGYGRPMCNFFANVILSLDAQYREHLTSEGEKEAKKQERQAKREASQKTTGKMSGSMRAGRRR